MQLQMTSQRYDRQQQQQHDQSPERVSKMNPEFHYPTEIQERQYQQRTKNRDGMSKAGPRRMSSGSINDNATGAAKTTPLHSRRDRDDCCHLHSPPSSPRPHGTNTPSATASPSQRNGRAGHRLSLSIPRLLRSDWVSLEGLVSCALSCLRKEECTRISELAADRRREYVPNHTSPHLLIYPSPSFTYISGIWEIGGSRQWRRNLRPIKRAGS
ncbi:hypothetical protein BDD12DRAFT_494187 [Trichophaea hybrida]|nr:hypothetical protein BDD12DRAFT_494187 [Trichophaea hybrida]